MEKKLIKLMIKNEVVEFTKKREFVIAGTILHLDKFGIKLVNGLGEEYYIGWNDFDDVNKYTGGVIDERV